MRDEADKEVFRLMSETDSPILTIPSIGFKLGSIILAEIRDIKNFRSPNQLLSYAGAEPSVSTSGMNRLKPAELLNVVPRNYAGHCMSPPGSCLFGCRLCVSIFRKK